MNLKFLGIAEIKIFLIDYTNDEVKVNIYDAAPNSISFGDRYKKFTYEFPIKLLDTYPLFYIDKFDNKRKVKPVRTSPWNVSESVALKNGK